jgi:putative nucleotidyltransferase with HDIG domain
MSTPTTTSAGALRADPEGEALVEAARGRWPQGLVGRERVSSWVSASAFVVAAAALALLLPWPRNLDPVLAAGLVAAYVVALRIRFFVGASFTVPTQLVFVPMLFLLPTPLVPALVALANLIGDLPDLCSRRRHPERAVLAIGDSWYALAPTLVLTIAHGTPFEPSLWPVYLAALTAQFALDLLVKTARDWFEFGIPVRRSLTDGSWIEAVDAALAPIGLLAAVASERHPWLFLLVLPPMALMELFARERQTRFDHARELRGAYQGTSLLLAELLEHDDEYTGVHSHEVLSLSLAVADELGLDARRRRDVECAALLHDVGKISVPKEIINKPSRLSESEWAVMRRHTIEGQRMLERVGGALTRVGLIVRASHERWDGRGYPDGLAGEQIPIEARIVCACDAYNAMTTDRPYRPALSPEQAREELRNNAGTQFDPHVVAALLRIDTGDETTVPSLRAAS